MGHHGQSVWHGQLHSFKSVQLPPLHFSSWNPLLYWAWCNFVRHWGATVELNRWCSNSSFDPREESGTLLRNKNRTTRKLRDAKWLAPLHSSPISLIISFASTTNWGGKAQTYNNHEWWQLCFSNKAAALGALNHSSCERIKAFLLQGTLVGIPQLP